MSTDRYFKVGDGKQALRSDRPIIPPVGGSVGTGIIEVTTRAEFDAAVLAYGGIKEIKIVAPFNIGTSGLSVSNIDHFMLTGLGRFSELTCGALAGDFLTLTDCNDAYVDNIAIDADGQTSGSGLRLIRVRRSSIGPTFLRIDNAHDWGINNNGSGAYPNSNAANVFGNIYVYTSGNLESVDHTDYCGGVLMGANTGDDRLGFAYIQECRGYGALLRGTHLQAGQFHIHETRQLTDGGHGVGMAIWTHAVDIRTMNIEGSDNSGLEIGFAGTANDYDVGARNHIGDLYSFDNNKLDAGGSDVIVKNADGQGNRIDNLITDGSGRSVYGFDDATNSSDYNFVGTHSSKDFKAGGAASNLSANSRIDHPCNWLH